MKPLKISGLTEEERKRLQAGLKSPSGFTVRRSQIILWSAEQSLSVKEIAVQLGCSGQAVRNAVHCFERVGVACLEEGHHARQDEQRALNDEARTQLRLALEQSPRTYGYDSSLWTLALLTDLSYRRGWTSRRVHIDTMSETLRSMGLGWKRAKQWISSPDANYAGKKSDEIG